MNNNFVACYVSWMKEKKERTAFQWEKIFQDRKSQSDIDGFLHFDSFYFDSPVGCGFVKDELEQKKIWLKA